MPQSSASLILRCCAKIARNYVETDWKSYLNILRRSYLNWFVAWSISNDDLRIWSRWCSDYLSPMKQLRRNARMRALVKLECFCHFLNPLRTTPINFEVISTYCDNLLTFWTTAPLTCLNVSTCILMIAAPSNVATQICIHWPRYTNEPKKRTGPQT